MKTMGGANCGIKCLLSTGRKLVIDLYIFILGKKKATFELSDSNVTFYVFVDRVLLLSLWTTSNLHF
jgi:hypothetical protein